MICMVRMLYCEQTYEVESLTNIGHVIFKYLNLRDTVKLKLLSRSIKNLLDRPIKLSY